MTPSTSIVVINRDDPGVANTLEVLTSLGEIRAGELEIVVVDASEGRLESVAESFPQAKWIAFPPVPDGVTIAQQRNVGVAASAGDIVVFIDASCVPGPDWLRTLCAPIRDGSETIVAGSHLSDNGQTFRDQATLRLRGLDYLPEAATINLALRRSVFDDLQGFDERFDYGSDVDFTWRAVDAGHRIRYVPDAVVSHDWGRYTAELRRSWRYGRARARLYVKHRDRWRHLVGRDVPLVVYPAYILLSPLTLRRPYLHLALAIPLLRNRGRRPVTTVVDHFVYGAGGLVELCSQVLGSRTR